MEEFGGQLPSLDAFLDMSQCNLPAAVPPIVAPSAKTEPLRPLDIRRPSRLVAAFGHDPHDSDPITPLQLPPPDMRPAAAWPLSPTSDPHSPLDAVLVHPWSGMFLWPNSPVDSLTMRNEDRICVKQYLPSLRYFQVDQTPVDELNRQCRRPWRKQSEPITIVRPFGRSPPRRCSEDLDVSKNTPPSPLVNCGRLCCVMNDSI